MTGHYFVIRNLLSPTGRITGEFRNVGVVVLHPDGSLLSMCDDQRTDDSLVLGFVNRVTQSWRKDRSVDTIILNLGKEAGSIRGGDVLATRIEKGLVHTARETYRVFVEGSCIPIQQKRELKVLKSVVTAALHANIDSITLTVNAGEKTCVSPDGMRCHFLRTHGPYGGSFCNLFEKDLLEGDRDGEVTTDPEKSWRLRLPECLESERNAHLRDEEFIVTRMDASDRVWYLDVDAPRPIGYAALWRKTKYLATRFKTREEAQALLIDQEVGARILPVKVDKS